MGYDLQIRKGGKIITSEWDFDENDFVEREVTDDEILFYIHDSVCLDKGVDLKDIFLLIATNIEIYSVVVACPFLIELVEEALEPADFYKDSNSIIGLEFKRIMEIDGPWMDHFFEFYGLGEDKNYSLDFFPLNELISYPVYLNETVLIKNKKRKLPILKTRQVFTLSEFLNGVIDELSFMGPPDLKEFTFESLKGSIPEDQDFKQFTTKDIEKRIKKEMKKNKIPCTICGKDSRADCFGKPKTLCEKCYRKTMEN